MLEYISNASLQNIPKMLGSFVFYVEGIFDQKLYSKYYQNVIMVGNDKSNGAKVKIIELAKNNDNILGIVDADFDVIENTVETCPRVFYTDLCDVETMVFFSPSIIKAIKDVYEIEKECFDRLVQNNSVVTAVRIINKRHNIGISFSKFISILKTNNMDINKSLSITLGNIPSDTLNSYCDECREILNTIDIVNKKICRWHDIEGIIIEKIFKKNNKNIKRLFEYFMLNEYKDFCSTNLSNKINNFLAKK